jgi:hypothetical protein
MKLLLCLKDATSIRRLRLTDWSIRLLSKPVFGDLGVVPPGLEYLTWGTFTYRVESREGKTALAVPAVRPYSGKAIFALDW